MQGVFVREPEINATIYHLSADDRVALCSRSVMPMICVGEGDAQFNGRLLIEITTSHTLMRRCCLQCKRRLEEARNGSQ